MDEKLKIGIMGGTFNPVHNGHLIIAESVRESLGLGKVLFIPCYIQPHKISAITVDGHHRLEMVKLATTGNPWFEVSDAEISREGVTYSIDTLKLLSKQYGTGARLIFIIGADTVWDLVNWKSFEEVFSICSFAAVQRPGYGSSRLKKRIEYLNETYDSDILMVKTPSIDISSTEIRKRIAAKTSTRYLIPESVSEYIEKHKLYAG